MRGVVPDAILDRRDKVGFVAPQRQWLVEMSSWVDRVLGSPAASRIPALNLPEVRQQWQRIQRDPRHHDPSLWRWCNLIEWSRQFDVAFE
jgi:asparagine synthase (glutamine-hydrolysing)